MQFWVACDLLAWNSITTDDQEHRKYVYVDFHFCTCPYHINVPEICKTAGEFKKIYINICMEPMSSKLPTPELRREQERHPICQFVSTDMNIPLHIFRAKHLTHDFEVHTHTTARACTLKTLLYFNSC